MSKVLRIGKKMRNCDHQSLPPELRYNFGECEWCYPDGVGPLGVSRKKAKRKPVPKSRGRSKSPARTKKSKTLTKIYTLVHVRSFSIKTPPSVRTFSRLADAFDAIPKREKRHRLESIENEQLVVAVEVEKDTNKEHYYVWETEVDYP